MKQNKLVSVTINAYNSEKYIAETLTSVINQSYKNLQIIVVDDASTDKTAEIVKSFDDPRIELYTLKNNGHISNANNECYRKVRGEYMVHIDSDDIMRPDLVEKTVGFLEEHQEYGAVFCRPTFIDRESNDVADEYLNMIFKCTAKTQAQFVRLFFDSSNHLLHPGCTMRKSVMDDIGFHDMSLCYLHDFDYWTRLVLKYPIYVLNEFLIKYRMDDTGEHNSDLSEKKTLAHDTEYARVMYNMINNCPDDMFLEAFSDCLMLEGKHTHEEVELEKAFLLQRGLIVLPQNRILSILKFSELFQDKKYVELARDKFNFTIRNFYELQSSQIFHNQVKIDTKQHEFNLQVIDLNNAINGLNEQLNQVHTNLNSTQQILALTKENLDLARENLEFTREQLDVTNQQLNHAKETIALKDEQIAQESHEHDLTKEELAKTSQELTCAREESARVTQELSQSYNHIANLNYIVQDREAYITHLVDLADSKQVEIERLNSIIAHKHRLLNMTVEYRIVSLVKKVYHLLKRVKHYLCLKDKNGKKYRKSVMLYGFYGMNFGDDLFFEKLITRYPNTMFLVYCFGYYRPFFEKFDNVKFYAYEDAFVQKMNRIGNKLKIHDMFEWLLLKRSKATVHIGGSIYQQIGDYDLDYQLRIRRKQPLKPFYSISCNFGEYKTEEYKHRWRKQFKKFKDICFRDKFSYDLFSDLKCVRYAPDLLFSYNASEYKQIDGSVAISVINPFASHRDYPQEICDAYLVAMKKTICNLVEKKQQVSILGFCTFEGDGEFIDKLLAILPQEVKAKIKVINYSFDNKEDIINALSTAEYIIGTRLHSIILGFAMGKKVLPITYNQKTRNILDDIGYDQMIVCFDRMGSYVEIGFDWLLDEIEKQDVSAHKNSDDLQFDKLDKFLK